MTETHRPPEDELNLDAYLKRIGHSDEPAATAEALVRLHEAHLDAIPFENLDILLGKTLALDLGALQQKLITNRRGGYCFEQNTLFQAALEQIGFRVTALAARVRVGTADVRARAHMLLRIDLAAGSFIADVGFGGDGPLRPIPLEQGGSIQTSHGRHRLRREDDLWVLESDIGGTWADLYAFTLEPQYPIDFVVANHYTSTYPTSGFAQNLTAQRLSAKRRVYLRNRELRVVTGRETKTTAINDPEHLLELLRRNLGLSFPAGTRFTQPEF